MFDLPSVIFCDNISYTMDYRRDFPPRISFFPDPTMGRRI
jgi:hypothetical protein